MTAKAPPTAAAKTAVPRVVKVDVDAMLQKAFLHHQAGRIAEAAAGYKRILKVAPGNVDAVHLMGLVLRAYGRHQEAEAMFRRTVALNPNFADAYYNLGNAYFSQGKFKKSVIAYHKAAKLQPRNAATRFNMGNAYKAMGDYARAAAALRSALAVDPNYTEAWHNLANVLKDGGFYRMAMDCYRRTLKLDRSLAEAHYNLALLLLLAGDMRQGFDQYEWRNRVQGLASPKRGFSQAQWTGKPIDGMTLLVHAEQNYADTLQFCRYLPMVAARGAKVIVECQAPLVELMGRVAGVSKVVEAGKPLPPFDMHCPLPSLPRAFATNHDSIPADIPYLKAHGLMVREWRRRLAEDGEFFRIGLVWTGNPQHGNDGLRSLSIRELMVLPQLPQIRYYSLQAGAAERELAETGLDKVIPNLAADIPDFHSMAAAISALDLLISIDAAPAHLAGALGKRVWLVVPSAPDWRWKRQGRATPWYPTFRLYRQKQRGDWQGVMQEVAADLLKTLQKKS